MIKFDEKGQAFWDFILENASVEFIEAIQKDLTRPLLPFEIINIRNTSSGNMVVYLSSGPSIKIHTEIKSDVSDKIYLYEDSLGIEDVRALNEVLDFE